MAWAAAASMAGLGGVWGQSGPGAGVPPLVVPYGPLLEAKEGWRQEGMLRDQAMAPAGEGIWLTASSYAEQNYTGTTYPAGRVVLRMVRETGGSFPPVTVSGYQSLYQGLEVVRGTGGAWAVWQDLTGVRAWWVSAATGQPSGSPLLLPGSAGGFQLVQSAGDGETAWITWRSVMGIQVVALGAGSGPPRIKGQGTFFAFSGFTDAQNYRIAAEQGRLLVVERTGEVSAPGPQVFSYEVSDTATLVDTAERWEGPGPQVGTEFYGVISYGSGWMGIWSQLLTPLLNGRVVYGRVLHPDGRPVESVPVQSLFVEPAVAALPYGGSPIWRGVVSSGGRGVVFALSQFDLADGQYIAQGFGYTLEPGQASRVVQPLPLGPARPSWVFYPGREVLPLAAGLQGKQLGMMVESGDSASYFAQELQTRDLAAPSWPPPVATTPVSLATGVQEEPALTWQEDAAVVAWQQKSNDQTGAEIIQRRYPAAGPGLDLSVTGTTTQPLSSPDMAANGSRILMVAKSDNLSGDPSDPDDVVGVILENGQAVSGRLGIGYGPGSQRAAAVTAQGDGFLVVWREELNHNTPDYQARIRAVALDRNGSPKAPGVFTVAVSVQELSAPAVAANGPQVCVVWKRQELQGTVVEASLVQTPFNGSLQVVSVFPDSFNGRSPDVAPLGTGFLVTARVNSAAGQDEIATVGLGLYGYGSRIDLPMATAGLMRGREPALAALGPDSAAVFWLKHETANRPSSGIWMAHLRSPGSVYQAPVQIQAGVFERDTLAVRGDGKGRVLVAVKSVALEDEGIRVFLLAPGVAGPPVVSRLSAAAVLPPAGAPVLSFRWTPNALFPAALEAVETSADLQDWSASGGRVTEPSGVGALEALFESAPAPGLGNRYFRLRPVFSGE